MRNIPILYHGTDARMIEMTFDERQTYLNACKQVLDYFWEIFSPYYLNWDLVETIIDGRIAFISKCRIDKYKDCIIQHSGNFLWSSILDKLQKCEAYKNNNPLYQYGSLYLTGDKYKATVYANDAFAGGEIGSISYRFIQLAEILKNEIRYEEFDAIKKIKAFAEAEPCPVLIPFSDLDANYLLTDKGTPLDNEDECILEILSFRYTKDYTLTLDNAIYLK